jgi:hypothetical protein
MVAILKDAFWEASLRYAHYGAAYANMFRIDQFGSALGTSVVSEGGVKWLLRSDYQSQMRLCCQNINHNLQPPRAWPPS